VIIDCLHAGHYFFGREWLILDPCLKTPPEMFGVNVIAGDDRIWLPQLAGGYFIIGVGYPLRKRKELFDAAVAAGVKPHIAIKHPSAVISAHAQVGEGTVVLANAVINISARVGRNVIINTGAIVEHDSVVGDHSHIAPGAVLCGGVTIGEGVMVGANATILPCVQVPDWTTIKAGSLEAV